MLVLRRLGHVFVSRQAVRLSCSRGLVLPCVRAEWVRTVQRVFFCRTGSTNSYSTRRFHSEAVRTVYRGFVLPDRQHEVVLLRVAAVYHVFLVWVTVRVRTTVRELIYVRSICF